MRRRREGGAEGLAEEGGRLRRVGPVSRIWTPLFCILHPPHRTSRASAGPWAGACAAPFGLDSALGDWLGGTGRRCGVFVPFFPRVLIHTTFVPFTLGRSTPSPQTAHARCTRGGTAVTPVFPESPAVNLGASSPIKAPRFRPARGPARRAAHPPAPARRAGRRGHPLASDSASPETAAGARRGLG